MNRLLRGISAIETVQSDSYIAFSGTPCNTFGTNSCCLTNLTVYNGSTYPPFLP